MSKINYLTDKTYALAAGMLNDAVVVAAGSNNLILTSKINCANFNSDYNVYNSSFGHSHGSIKHSGYKPSEKAV